jgi:AraC-like DNA-binding protein
VRYTKSSRSTRSRTKIRFNSNFAPSAISDDRKTQGWLPGRQTVPPQKKGRRDWAAQVLGGTRPEAKRLLNPSRPQNDRRLFPAVFTQKGKWLRDRFFGTDAVKSVHGFERQCADLAQMPSRMMARTVTDRMAAVAPRVRARAAEPLSGRLAPWQVKRACEKLEADLSGKLTLQEIAAELGISVSHFSRALRTFVGLPPHQRLLRQRISAAKQLMTVCGPRIRAS